MKQDIKIIGFFLCVFSMHIMYGSKNSEKDVPVAPDVRQRVAEEEKGDVSVWDCGISASTSNKEILCPQVPLKSSANHHFRKIIDQLEPCKLANSQTKSVLSLIAPPPSSALRVLPPPSLIAPPQSLSHRKFTRKPVAQQAAKACALASLSLPQQPLFQNWVKESDELVPSDDDEPHTLAIALPVFCKKSAKEA